MRIVIVHGDRRVSTGYASAFDPKDGSVMVSLSPTSPAGTLVQLESIELLVLEPTDGKPLPKPSLRDPARGVRVEFADGRTLIGTEGTVEPHGVWMRPPQDLISRAFIPKGAARVVELLDDEVEDVPEKMWAFLDDSTPTDEVEIPTGPTDLNPVVSREE